MNTYDVRVYEKAEGWYFYETVNAISQEEARVMVRKMYGKGYVVMG